MNKKMVKKSEKPVAVRAGKGKGLKIALIAATSFFFATTVTFATLYTIQYVANNSSAQMTEEVREFIEKVKNLNKNSDPSEVDEAWNEYERMTAYEKNLLTKEAKNQIILQHDILTNDRNDSEELDTLVSALDNVSDTDLKIKKAENQYAKLSDRARTKIADPDGLVLEQIEAARSAFTNEKASITSLVNRVRALGNTCTRAEMDAVKSDLDSTTTSREDLLKTLNEARTSWTNTETKYNSDKAKVNEYSAAASNLNIKKDFAVYSEILTVKTLQQEAKLINSGRKNDFEDTIEEADGLLDEVDSAYSTDKANVESIHNAIKNNLNKATCTSTGINNATDAYNTIKDIKRSDLTSLITDTKTMIDEAREAFGKDEATVEENEAVFDKFYEKETTGQSCTANDLLGAKNCLDAISALSSKRGNEWANKVATITSKLESMNEAYTDQFKAVNTYKSEVDELPLGTCEEAAITPLEEKYTELAAAIKRQDLKNILDESYKTVASERTAYNKEKSELEAYEAGMSTLYSNKTSCTIEQINAVEELAKKVSSERPSFIARKNTRDEQMSEVKGLYDADEAKVIELETEVTTLDSNKTSCTQTEITSCSNKINTLSSEITRQDLLDRIDVKETIVENIQALYDEDETKVDELETEVTTLDNNKTTCTQVEITACSNEINTLTREIARADLLSRINAKKTIVENIQKLYSKDEEKVVELEADVTVLDNNKATCTQTEITACSDKVTALTSEITRQDLLNRINTKGAVVQSIQVLYDADEAKVDELDTKVQLLNDTTSLGSEIVEAETLLGEVKAGAGKRGNDFTSTISSLETTLKQRRHYYDRDVSFISDLVEWTNDEGSNPTTLRYDFTHYGADLKETVGDIVREDLLSQASAAIAGFDAKFAEVEAENNAAIDFNEKVNSLTSTSTDAEIKAVEALRPVVEKIKRRDIISENYITSNISKLESIRESYNEDASSSETLYDEIDSFYNATAITQTSVDSVRSDYEIASTRVKTLTNAKCQEEHSKGIEDIFDELDTALTEGAEINSEISEFPGAYSSFQDSQKIHLLKFLPEYDAIDQTSFKWKVITANNKTKVETLREELASAKFEKITDVTLSGDGIVTGSESSITDEYFGACSSATVINNTQAKILTISASKIAEWKAKYSTVVCYIWVESPSGGMPTCSVCNSKMEPVGGTEGKIAAGEFCRVEIDLTSEFLVTPDDITFYLMQSANSAIKLTSIYGTPNS